MMNDLMVQWFGIQLAVGRPGFDFFVETYQRTEKNMILTASLLVFSTKRDNEKNTPASWLVASFGAFTLAVYLSCQPCLTKDSQTERELMKMDKQISA